jgi:hypothetical protein
MKMITQHEFVQGMTDDNTRVANTFTVITLDLDEAFATSGGFVVPQGPNPSSR